MAEQHPVIIPAHVRGLTEQTAELLDSGATPEEVIKAMAAQLQLSDEARAK